MLLATLCVISIAQTQASPSQSPPPFGIVTPLVLATSSKERKDALERMLDQSLDKDALAQAGFHMAKLEPSGIAYIDDVCVASKLMTDFERLMRLIDAHPSAQVVQIDELDPATRRALGKLFMRSPVQGRPGATRMLVPKGVFAYRPFLHLVCHVNDKSMSVHYHGGDDDYGGALCEDQLPPDKLKEIEQRQNIKSELDRFEKELDSPAYTFTFRGDQSSHTNEMSLLEQTTQAMKKLAAKQSESRSALEQKALKKFIQSLGVKEWPLAPNTKFQDLPDTFQQAMAEAAISGAGPGADKAAVLSFLQKSTVTVAKSGYMIDTGYYDKATDTGHISGNSLASIKF